MNILIIVISILISNAPVQDSGYQSLNDSVAVSDCEVSYSVSKDSNWGWNSWNSNLYVLCDDYELYYSLRSFEDNSYRIDQGFSG